ncbi:uncharacterized protein [Gossypium hirsutum]|uniref:Uncharacterized protein n=1 Tax=Gossypium hirsutum TaxID=3635 RepID=A0A1U8N5L5_GOSHI|nr:uncharacterized protein LOC107945058 [Gossypium hirsutum]
MVSHQQIGSVVDSDSTPTYHPTSGSSRGRGHGRMSGSRIQCQLCGKTWHLIDHCYHRFDAKYKSTGYRSPQENVCMLGNGSLMPSWELVFSLLMSSPTMASYGNWVFSPSPTLANVWFNPFCTTLQPKSASTTTSVLSPNPQAYVATPDIVGDNAWYPDSSATHHLTHSASIREQSTPYNAPSKVYVDSRCASSRINS